MSLPKSYGHINLKNLEVCNKADLVKLLWAVTMNKETLWIKWMNNYYTKANNPMSCHVPNTASQCAKKILRVLNAIANCGGQDNFLNLV